VLRVRGFPVTDAAGAEHCGYGTRDLSLVEKIWRLKGEERIE
jgi:hypothetical protein